MDNAVPDVSIDIVLFFHSSTFANCALSHLFQTRTLNIDISSISSELRRLINKPPSSHRISVSFNDIQSKASNYMKKCTTSVLHTPRSNNNVVVQRKMQHGCTNPLPA